MLGTSGLARQNNKVLPPGGRRYDLSLSASERRKPTPAPGAALLAFWDALRQDAHINPLPGRLCIWVHSTRPHFCPGHPRVADLSSPLPFTQTIPSQPQQARPSVGARASRPQSPAPPAVTSSCKVRERSRRLQLSGQPGAPGAAVRRGRALQTCGGGGVGPPLPPPRVQGRPAGGASSAERSVPWVGGWHSHTFWMTACREEGKRTRAHC